MRASFLAALVAASPCVAQADRLRADGPIPSPTVAYADVLAMVKAGGDVRVAFGVPAPRGYAAVDMDSPGASAVPKGLWRCWREGRSPQMERADAKPQAAHVSRVASGSGGPVLSGSLGPQHWTWPGDLDQHLQSAHGQNAASLAGLSGEQKASLHDQLHNSAAGFGSGRSAPAGGGVMPYAPVPNLQHYLRPGGVGGYTGGFGGGNCPGGSCPSGGPMLGGFGGFGGGCPSGRCPSR